MAIRLTDSIEALRNDYDELMQTFHPARVRIERQTPAAGDMCLLKVTLSAPCYVLTSKSDVTPKQVSSVVFYVQVPSGYPETKPTVYYPSDCYNASVNVFRHGTQCTDKWGRYSSLRSLVEKTLLDAIHCPTVSRYDSMANSSVEAWQREMTEAKKLPTIPPKQLFRNEAPPLPLRPKAPALPTLLKK